MRIKGAEHANLSLVLFKPLIERKVKPIHERFQKTQSDCQIVENF
jgi:hypothetical protein